MATDYSKLPIGTKMERGEIKVCPYCNKIGLVTETNEVFFTQHTGIQVRDEKGNLHTGGEECPKPGQTLIPVSKEPLEENE